MPTAEEMQSLGEELSAAARERRSAIAGIKEDATGTMRALAEGSAARKAHVAEALSSLDTERRAMAAELHAKLEADNRVLMAGLAEGTAARNAEVAGMLSSLDAEHKAMAAELYAKLKADNQALMAELQALDAARDAAVGEMLSSFDAEHRAMAEELRAELAKIRPTLAADTDALMGALVQGTATRKAEVADTLSGFDAGHRAMAAGLRAELVRIRPTLAADTDALMGALAQGTAARKGEVAEMLSSLDAEHRAMAAELHAKLKADNQALMAELQALDAARDAAVGEMLSSFDAEHRSMAEELKAELGKVRPDLAADTDALMSALAEGTAARKGEAAKTLSGHRAEMEASRKAWQEHLRPNTRPQVEVVEKVVAPPSPPVVETAPPPFVEALPEAKEEVVPDDLTAIRGIGYGMQRRLNEGAGIYTYAQLAKRTPEGLREILGAAARLARVEEWIEQAQRLAG